MSARTILLSCLAAAALVGGCRSRGPGAAPAPEVDPNTPVPVTIESHYQGDVVIYLVQGGARERLGMVSALGTAEFSFPWRRLQISTNTRLLAYPIAGSKVATTDPLLLQPGQGVSWTLEADLGRSSMAVY